MYEKITPQGAAVIYIKSNRIIVNCIKAVTHFSVGTNKNVNV